jgi:hypothetical protein
MSTTVGKGSTLKLRFDDGTELEWKMLEPRSLESVLVDLRRMASNWESTRVREQVANDHAVGRESA